MDAPHLQYLTNDVGEPLMRMVPFFNGRSATHEAAQHRGWSDRVVGERDGEEPDDYTAFARMNVSATTRVTRSWVMGDNLQVIVDEMRDELASGSGGFWCIKHDKLARPLFFEVVAGGPSWHVFAECDGRTLLSGDTVEPAALVSDLYVLLRRLIRQLTEPAPKPS